MTYDGLQHTNIPSVPATGNRAGHNVATTARFTIRGTMYLSRFALGRVLLHVLAMLGDGCFRFHVAGITRELTWLALAPTLFTRTHRCLIRASMRRRQAGCSDRDATTELQYPGVVRVFVTATALLLTLIPSVRAAGLPEYGFEAAAQEITQLFWLAETATACGWAQDADAAKFRDFSVRFLMAHLSQTHRKALASLVTEERYKAELRRAAWEGVDQNCTNSRWRLGWLSFKAAADEHETEY
ncbi:MAG: hypothetical protein C5B46_09690 [Proteobacteria bacterium]|nr:MAG: hypothetical protein C5B46_09690 [Pseudomonadota bacterium]